jgi:hypothetical protein
VTLSNGLGAPLSIDVDGGTLRLVLAALPQYLTLPAHLDPVAACKSLAW